MLKDNSHCHVAITRLQLLRREVTRNSMTLTVSAVFGDRAAYDDTYLRPRWTAQSTNFVQFGTTLIFSARTSVLAVIKTGNILRDDLN
jgi:hypothetical protein